MRSNFCAPSGTLLRTFVRFCAFCQAIGQITYIRPYVTDFSLEWVASSVGLLVLGSVVTVFIGEKLSDIKLGNGTSLLIFTNIVSYLPASVGRTVVQAFTDSNYVGLAGLVLSFFLLVLGIVYVQVRSPCKPSSLCLWSALSNRMRC